MRVHVHKFGHPKVGNLGSIACTDQQDVVSREISVDDCFEVEVAQGEC